MSDLPDGWSRSTIKDLAGASGIFVDGDWVESKDQDPNGDIRLLQLADIGDGTFLDKSNRWINEDAFRRIRCTELATGDVLIARMPDPLGRSCLMPVLEQLCVTVVDVAALRVDPQMADNRWVMHTINAPQLRAEISAQSSGTTRKRISRGNLGSLQIPLPPGAEQGRIADKLDTVLARVVALNTRLARVAPTLKRLRQSILAAAASGRLTEGWRATEKSSNVLSLGKLVSCISGSGFPPAMQGRPEGDLPFAKVSDISNAVQNNFGLLDSAAHYVSYQEAAAIKAKVIPIGSTVFAKIGEGLKLNRRAKTTRPVLIDNNCMALVPDESRILPEYLYLLMKTVDLGQFAIATAVPSVRRGDIENVEVELPSLSEQSEIVRRVETLFAFADRLEARLQAAKVAAGRLTPALLAKAFRGELVPQDAKDEPASELLHRLQTERPGSRSTRGGRAAA